MSTRIDIPQLVSERFPSSTSSVSLFYNNGTHEVRDAWVMVTNAGSSSANATIWFVRNGGSPATKDIVLNNFAVPANSYPVVVPLPPLQPKDEVHVRSSVASTLIFRLIGIRRP